MAKFKSNGETQDSDLAEQQQNQLPPSGELSCSWGEGRRGEFGFYDYRTSEFEVMKKKIITWDF